MANIFTSIEGACGGSKAETPNVTEDARPTGSEAPPPYSTLPSAPIEGSGATAWPGPLPIGSVGYVPRGFKLSYMDFVPRILKKKLIGSVYEDYSVLLQRANQWIEDHDGISVVSCETVTWTGHHYEDIYADKCYTLQGQRAIRGLRMWYMTEIVPSPHRRRNAQVLLCKTFQPKPNETFSSLLRRVNDALVSQRIGGKILCVETVPLYIQVSEYKPGAVNPDITRWSGDLSHSTVALCMRVYVLVTGEPQIECIGYQDFVPEHTQRHADNRGFEVCAELMDKATRWVARQQGVRFTNVQTLNVKYKKKIPFEERCVFTSSDTTVFLSIVRVFYVTPNAGTERLDLPPCRLTYRTFTPAQTVLGTSSSTVEFEDTRNLCDRINQWLQITGAQLFAIETVPVRLSPSSLGSEATFFKSKSAGERWLYHIRVYLNGDYVEPPGAANLVFSSQAKIAVSEPNLYLC